MKKWIIIGLLVFFVGLPMLGWALGWFGQARDVAMEEFGPRAMLEKYEWFIDQENRIQKMDQDIAIFEQRLKSVDQRYDGMYGGTNKAGWPPVAQVQYNRERQIAYDDIVAIVSQRNNLAREYNAQSEKFNWEPFRSRPDLPMDRFSEYKIQ